MGIYFQDSEKVKLKLKLYQIVLKAFGIIILLLIQYNYYALNGDGPLDYFNICVYSVSEEKYIIYMNFALMSH